MGLVNGFFYVGGFILYQYNIRKNGVTMSATFMKLGVLVPTLTAIIVFGERPGGIQICGIILAVAAILVLNLNGRNSRSGVRKAPDISAVTDDGSNTDIVTVTTPRALIALLLMGGSGDAMSKIYEELGSSDLNEHFLFYTFISAIILCTVAAVWSRQGLTRDDVFFGCLIGIPNFYTARFLLAALSYVPAVIVYPTYSTGTIILVSIAGMLLFHEKITPRQKTAILMILAALVLLNS
jgi:drug/metabolite transporter (DMT)-like permease